VRFRAAGPPAFRITRRAVQRARPNLLATSVHRPRMAKSSPDPCGDPPYNIDAQDPQRFHDMQPSQCFSRRPPPSTMIPGASALVNRCRRVQPPSASATTSLPAPANVGLAPEHTSAAADKGADSGTVVASANSNRGGFHAPMDTNCRDGLRTCRGHHPPRIRGRHCSGKWLYERTQRAFVPTRHERRPRSVPAEAHL